MSYYDRAMLGYEIDLGSDIDILGDDDVGEALEILGAAKRRKKGGGLARAAQAVAAAKQAGGVIVRTREPSEKRLLTLQVDSGAALIAAAATQSLQIQSTGPFKAVQFLVDPTSALSFLITDIKVGRKSQLMGTGSIPATMFSALNPSSRVEWDTAQTAEPLVITVQNNSAAAARFVGGLMGYTVE